SYSNLIAHNSIHVEWDTGSAAGISVRGGAGEIAHAIVVDNDVNMDAPEGTVFDDRSAGIEITNNAHDNVVQGNRITGHAKAALSVGPQTVFGVPANKPSILNRPDGFEPTLADIFVGDGVPNTLIVGRGTVEDHGIGTVIVPVGPQK